jgi:hypothetical protein
MNFDVVTTLLPGRKDDYIFKYDKRGWQETGEMKYKFIRAFGRNNQNSIRPGGRLC